MIWLILKLDPQYFFNFGCDSPGGIQIKIQISKISELDSNTKVQLFPCTTFLHSLENLVVENIQTTPTLEESIPTTGSFVMKLL